jgi:hypothetical protein
MYVKNYFKKQPLISFLKFPHFFFNPVSDRLFMQVNHHNLSTLKLLANLLHVMMR